MGHLQPVVLVSSEGEEHEQLLWVFIIIVSFLSLCLTIKASLVGKARGVLRSFFVYYEEGGSGRWEVGGWTVRTKLLIYFHCGKRHIA